VDFDERKSLRSQRLGMYFRQSLIGMVKYKEHGNVLADDFEDSSIYDEDANEIYVENLYNKEMMDT
jgi:hypothetical protein